MELMKYGDIFDTKHIYCSYYKDDNCDNTMKRVYIFTVRDNYEYKKDNDFDIYVIRHLFVQYDMVRKYIRGFDSESRLREHPQLIHIQYEEVWRLTEDETFNILSEVI
jgi:hypothetical protein